MKQEKLSKNRFNRKIPPKILLGKRDIPLNKQDQTCEKVALADATDTDMSWVARVGNSGASTSILLSVKEETGAAELEAEGDSPWLVRGGREAST
jgi:hypothetical protein